MSSLLLPGDAGFADVLAGKKFSAGSKFNAQGTMPNNGAVTLTPSGNGTVAIPAGYHNGSGIVSQVNVPAANVLTGTTIAGVAGTMPNQGSPSWTPGPNNILLPAGYYAGGTIQGDADLIADNILSGKNIFGVAGNVQKVLRATGSGTISSSGDTVNLGFQPKTVILLLNGASNLFTNRSSYAQVDAGGVLMLANGTSINQAKTINLTTTVSGFTFNAGDGLTSQGGTSMAGSAYYYEAIGGF